MNNDTHIVDMVRISLANTPYVTEKRMFGVIGFMVNGKLAIGAGGKRNQDIMVRVGKDAYEEALQNDGAEPTIMGEREMKGYVSVYEDVLQTQADVDYWVDLALQFNKTLVKGVS